MVTTDPPLQLSPTFHVTYSRTLVYPNISQLGHGAQTRSRITLSVSFANPTAQATTEKLLHGQSALHASVLYSVQGLQPHPATTAAGRFTNTVGLRVSYVGWRFPPIPSSTVAVIAKLLAKSNTVWFAKGVGLVWSSMTGETRIPVSPTELVGCTGLRGVGDTACPPTATSDPDYYHLRHNTPGVVLFYMGNNLQWGTEFWYK